MNKILIGITLALSLIVLPRVALCDSDIHGFESRPEYLSALASMKNSINGCITANSGFALSDAAPVSLKEHSFKIQFPIMGEDGPSMPPAIEVSGNVTASLVLDEMSRITQANLEACNDKLTSDGATAAVSMNSVSYRQTAALSVASTRK